jgi:hypothetical protein
LNRLVPNRSTVELALKNKQYSILLGKNIRTVPGAILAVPMLAILKIISDRLRPLKALGHFLEGE